MQNLPISIFRISPRFSLDFWIIGTGAEISKDLGLSPVIAENGENL